MSNIPENFSSGRRMDFVTPGSFLKKIIIISTMWNSKEGGAMSDTGQTAIAHVSALNHLHALEKHKEWDFKVLKEHKDYDGTFTSYCHKCGKDTTWKDSHDDYTVICTNCQHWKAQGEKNDDR